MLLSHIGLFLCLSATIFSVDVPAQDRSIVEGFRVFARQGKAHLHWTVISGFTCSGIKIFRWDNASHFVQIAAIEGVCGSFTSSESYDFIDETPIKNSINSYRLELGGNGITETVSIEIVSIENGSYSLRPNPVVSEAKIYFDNNPEQEHRLDLYSLDGIKVFSSLTASDVFQIDMGSLQPGVYCFSIFGASDNLFKTSGNILFMR